MVLQQPEEVGMFYMERKEKSVLSFQYTHLVGFVVVVVAAAAAAAVRSFVLAEMKWKWLELELFF